MIMNRSVPFWHKVSYDHFLEERLPNLLAERLPLAGYAATVNNTYTCKITVTVDGPTGSASHTFAALPYPDEVGIFALPTEAGSKELRTVVPWVAHSNLDRAAVKCVGDLLYDWVDGQLGEAPADLPWDTALLRAWLPLEKWLHEFMQRHPHAQLLDVTNWLARQSHPRRIIIEERTALTTPSQFGRVDPFEIPEGPNMGRIFALALGAAIRDGAIVIDDDSPAAMLGTTTVMIPCLEHDDPNRLLMGANMMRQWLPYRAPEPALVQTGNEQNAPYFWCGRNLLTAFMPWGEDTFEDGLVLSASAAHRLSNLHQGEMVWSDGSPFDLYHKVAPGDKLSNRHGTKGVVSRIMPDQQMPHLADGTVVDLIVSSLRLPGRMNLGQLYEALLGRLARHEGAPIIAPPFAGPSESAIRQRLTAADLPEDGLETLLSHGKPLAHPSLVGWLYWGRTNHLARNKMLFAVDSSHQGQRMGDMEVDVLRRIGAVETLHEHFSTRAIPALTETVQQQPLVEQIAVGPVEQTAAPTPRFVQLQQRLAAAGIQATLAAETVHFTFAPVTGESLQLARPVPHPWLPTAQLTKIGRPPAASSDEEERVADRPAADYRTLQQVNAKLARLVASQVPESLITPAHTLLKEQVDHYLTTLLTSSDLRLDGRALFTGRAVLVPGPGLPHDRISLPEEMAWAFFGPQVARTLGTDVVAKRTEAAAEFMDEIMADSWVILHYAPATEPTAFLAFRPLRAAEEVVRLPSLACPLLNADFDGDQVAIHLPITEAGQHEAATRLSIAAHLTLDPTLLERLTKQDEAIWGLAYDTLTATGQSAIERAAGVAISLPDGCLTRATLQRSMQTLLAQQGAEAMLTALRNLVQLGFAIAAGSGFSMSPFVGDSIEIASAGKNDDPAALAVTQAQVAEQILALRDFDRDLGPYVLGIKSGAIPETHLRALTYILGVSRTVTDVNGQPATVHHGFRTGLQPDDFIKIVPGARAGMGQIWQAWEALGAAAGTTRAAQSFAILARARRAQHPGVVFAQAAACGEVDPLADEESRLFVGLI